MYKTLKYILKARMIYHIVGCFGSADPAYSEPQVISGGICAQNQSLVEFSIVKAYYFLLPFFSISCY